MALIASNKGLTIRPNFLDGQVRGGSRVVRSKQRSSDQSRERIRKPSNKEKGTSQ